VVIRTIGLRNAGVGRRREGGHRRVPRGRVDGWGRPQRARVARRRIGRRHPRRKRRGRWRKRHLLDGEALGEDAGGRLPRRPWIRRGWGRGGHALEGLPHRYGGWGGGGRWLGRHGKPLRPLQEEADAVDSSGEIADGRRDLLL
jgi:hypothetical protein